MIPWVEFACLVLVAAQAVLIGLLLAARARRGKLQRERESVIGALKESEARNKAILAALPDLMFLLDAHGTYLDWYAGEPGDLYVPPEKFIGRNVREIMPPELADTFANVFQRVLLSGTPQTVEYNLDIKGEVRFFETRIVKCGDRKLLSIVRNITEKKHFEMESQRLSSQLLNFQDDERQRIATELHDVTAQNLFAIALNLKTLGQHHGLDPSSVEIVDQCCDLCERSLDEIRTLSYLLHPPEFERVGLLPTLRWYVEGFAKRSGIAIRFDAPSDLPRLPTDMEKDLFRVVQEGLFNVFRHSGSRSASVLLERRIDGLGLAIKDNGRGLRSSTGPSDSLPDTLGVGIPSMRARLRRLGGDLRIESSSDGVLLAARVPFPADKVAHEAAN